MNTIYYFAYGSNMSSKRLRARLPTCESVGVGILRGYRLEFHKPGIKDGSGKCGVIESDVHEVHGVLFHIDANDKTRLDALEGVGHGYVERIVSIAMAPDNTISALTYCATVSDPQLTPFTWYKRHVLEGAREFSLPADYIATIEAVAAIADPITKRELAELAIYG